MRKIKIIWALVGLLGVVACDEDILDAPDASEQIVIDNKLIDAYIAEKGYDTDAIDTTASGIRVLVLDSGQDPQVNYGDIVSLHLTGRFTDGQRFYTNIDTVAINDDSYDSTRVYAPIVFTHSPGGWALTEAADDTGPYALCNFTGFTKGVTAAMERINIGGKAVILSPSARSLGSGVPAGLSTTEVLIFELYPTHVK